MKVAVETEVAVVVVKAAVEVGTLIESRIVETWFPAEVRVVRAM